MALDRTIIKQVEQAVKRAESRCKAEFVCVWAKRSSEYRVLKLATALLAGFLVALSELAMQVFWGVSGDWVSLGVFFTPLVTAIVVYVLMHWGWAFRVLLPDVIFARTVRLTAELEFYRRKVFATSARTGVLIYVTEFEHEVIVLADEGLAAVTTAEEWSDLGVRLAGSFASLGTASTFEDALERIAKKLEERMGPRTSVKNELSDELRT